MVRDGMPGLRVHESRCDCVCVRGACCIKNTGGGFAAAISHARMRLARLGRIGHAGRIAGRVGAVVAPFLSPTMWEQHAGVLGGGGGRAGGIWALVFLAELAGSGRRRVEVRVACCSFCGLTGSWVGLGPCVVPAGCFFLVRPGWVLAPVLAGVGVCAEVRFCSVPVRVLCVSPRSRPAPPCVFEQYCVYRVLVRCPTYGKRATPPAARRLPPARTSSGPTLSHGW